MRPEWLNEKDKSSGTLKVTSFPYQFVNNNVNDNNAMFYYYGTKYTGSISFTYPFPHFHTYYPSHLAVETLFKQFVKEISLLNGLRTINLET